MNKDNKLIFINTIIIYVRMVIVTLVGLFSSRFVLQALGVSDFGLYNVVGGLIAMLNFISAAMSTTTRRYINIEMGKMDGNLNKVFNISLLLHVFFALFILLIAETLGLWYINNYLNVDAGKELDAMFVFQISTIVACLGVLNIPYQSLIEANERFLQSALIDIGTTFAKFGLVILMLYYQGNTLRFYAMSVCAVTLISFVLYHYYCRCSWKEVVKFRFYKDKTLYKEILSFNNLTALGAAASIGKSQGSTLLINYYFGTFINGAFAIAFQIENYVYMFVNKLTLSTNPQIAKSFSSGCLERANHLVKKNSRYSILIMIIFFFTLTPEMDYILKIWLKDVPIGASFLCKLTMIDALVKSFNEGTNGYVQASGKIKWFQYITSVLLLLNLPLGVILFRLGFPAYWIIICFIFTSVINRIISLWLMKILLNFPLRDFIVSTYFRPITIIALLVGVYYVLHMSGLMASIHGLTGIVIFFFVSILLSFLIGLEPNEKEIIFKLFRRYASV